MKRQTLALLVGLLALTAGIVLARFSPARWLNGSRPGPAPAAPAVTLKAGDYEISGPYTHENLTVFLLHGRDNPGAKPFLTLEEALGRQVVVVHETQEVNELAVENVSPNEEVFVQAGDIVKGGQQDRVLSVDLIVPARSGRMPVDAFCVEHGRWSRRGEERVMSFGVSPNMLATKELKMAAKSARSQEKVWAEVEQAQTKLSASTRAEVRNYASASSLQLTLENDKVRERAGQYVRELSSIIKQRPDVLGFAFAVNGKFSGADVYSSGELFRRLWPRLLEAAAVEAVAELASGEKSASVSASAEAIRDACAGIEKGKESEIAVTKRTRMVKREGELGVFFETRDAAQGGAWVHRNYLSK